MISSRLPRALTSLAVGALAATAVAAPAAAQGQPNMGLGPSLPKSGSIPRDTAYERRVLAQVKAPEGFTLLNFAGPPFAMYPTAVAPAPDGSVYVGVDLNLAQGAVKGRGRVVRLVDTDGDGRADKYTIFADVDSPRGIAVDGNTVYVMHPPNLTAYRDTNGDGIADTADDIVKDLGFGLDVRSVGPLDQQHHARPRRLDLRRGGRLRLPERDREGRHDDHAPRRLARARAPRRHRPRDRDAPARATSTTSASIRSATSFTRDNTNDGGGWDTRFHWLAPGANMGYPSLFLHFRDEHMPSIADYGAGSGTAGLWIQDPGFPDQWNNTLYTGDWTINKVFHHPLERKGASWSIKQDDFMSVPRIDRHGDGRPVAPVRGEPHRRRVQLREATRSARSSA